MSVELSFTLSSDSPTLLDKADTLVIVGRQGRLLSNQVLALVPDAELWRAMLTDLSPGDEGSTHSTWVRLNTIAKQLVACVLPEPCSRYNSPARPHAISDLVKNVYGKGTTSILLALDEDAHSFAAGCALARTLPVYSRKENGKDREVVVALLGPNGLVDPTRADLAASIIRNVGALVDMPTNELNTTVFVDRARKLAESLGAQITVIEGEALDQAGYGGLWNVGKTAPNPPALVVLSHIPAGASGEPIVWVGKGVVYDTGGLSLKERAHMVGMKCDMGGAAAAFGAFEAAVRSNHKAPVHAILCLAENSIGPEALRPDDVITLYSGKTVEINNTDAEGRLVLGDGVAYAAKHLSPSVIVDLATLTGAQLVATGKRPAAIMSNDEALEARAVAAGKSSGDLTHALPYCPEFFRSEFRSKVADMKNSVKDRMNAQASCAGQFVANHLVDYEGPWLHIDLAGPAFVDERGTGYGVALLMDLFDIGI